MNESQRIALAKELDKVIVFQNPHHPAGRSSLFLNPLERDEIIRRMEKVLDAR